jgi:hypothetical protein
LSVERPGREGGWAALQWLALCLLLIGALVEPAPVRASRTEPVASYVIDVTLDSEAKTLTAQEVVTYVNTTDEPIPDLVFHLYLNAFSGPDTVYMQESGMARSGAAQDPQRAGSVDVLDIRLTDGTPLVLEEIEDGTLARADLPVPVAPGASIEIALDFQAELPRVFARTGYVDDFFMVGQWFPKLGVWEDGAWNAHPFHANAEFYADFGTYEVSITLPSEYVTGATGLPVATQENADGTQTVRYRAEDVIDFAWVASPRFLEATRRVEGVEILYLYLPEHEGTVERVLDAAEAAMRLYGDWYGPYPYERLTVGDVPDEGQGAGGMEYPTLIMAGSLFGPAGLEGFRLPELVVMHEVGHQWWQSMVAFNEAEEPWLDEGFTDYSATRAVAQTYGASTSLLDIGPLEVGYLDLRRAEYLSQPRLPMYGPAWSFEGHAYSIATYAKPILALTTLERVLGERTMMALMRTFFRRYQFAHPTTEEFRDVAEEVAGQDLDWFFDGLVYGDGVLNYAVTEVTAQRVTLSRQGDLVVPTEVLITFADGSEERVSWDGGEATLTLAYPDRPPVRRAQIDPERKLVVDVAWHDNGLSRRAEVAPWLALVSRLVGALQGALLGLGGP